MKQEVITELHNMEDEYVIFPSKDVADIVSVTKGGETLSVKRFIKDIIYLYEEVTGEIEIKYKSK